jgi:3-dehydroquinate dehydratase
MSLATPQAVESRLEALDIDLAIFQNEIEEAALDWFRAKREREKAHASAFLTAKGSIAARHAVAELETCTQGMDEEAVWEAKRHKLKVLESRAAVAMSILKAQSR